MQEAVKDIGALRGNIRRKTAEPNDYYATEPKATELLLEQETFHPRIWEPACGQGHISKVLEKHGYSVFSTDLIDRGYGQGNIDFLAFSENIEPWDGDIITNPPYRHSKEFAEKALRLMRPGQKLAMFLKLTFLEGQSRREFFRRYPPQTIYVSSARLQCGRNGEFWGSSAVAYAWFVWRKGHPGPTVARWIN